MTFLSDPFIMERKNSRCKKAQLVNTVIGPRYLCNMGGCLHSCMSKFSLQKHMQIHHLLGYWPSHWPTGLLSESHYQEYRDKFGRVKFVNAVRGMDLIKSPRKITVVNGTEVSIEGELDLSLIIQGVETRGETRGCEANSVFTSSRH